MCMDEVLYGEPLDLGMVHLAEAEAERVELGYHWK
jgi:hypothetical protein